MGELERLRARVETLEWFVQLMIREALAPQPGAEASRTRAEHLSMALHAVTQGRVREAAADPGRSPGDVEREAGQRAPLLLKVPEAARLLGVSRTRVYELMQRGELPVIRLGRSVRIPYAALQGWIDEQLGP